MVSKTMIAGSNPATFANLERPMPLSDAQRKRLADKLNGPCGPDQVTWIDEDDEFDLINDRLDGIEDSIAEMHTMLRMLLTR